MSDKVLFISGRCPHSKNILIGIQQYEFMKTIFKIVNIDKQPYPNYIKTVPSLLINGQIIAGDTLFEYLGKLVEGKQQQEGRIKQNQLQDKDKGECKINEEGELEGWCSSGMSVDFSMITEDNDDYTKKMYKMDSNYEYLNGSSSIQDQVKQMEQKDQMINHKKKEFDNNYERLQRERGEIGNGMPHR